MQAAYPQSLAKDTLVFDHGAPMRRIGGQIDTSSGSVQLRILVDHSLVEVFTKCGRALSTRWALDPSLCMWCTMQGWRGRLTQGWCTLLPQAGVGCG